MSKTRKQLKDHKARKQIARIMKLRLAFLIAFLIVLLLVLIFGIGEDLWPGWMVRYRTQTAGILSFVVICLILLSPIIVEASSNTRALSGPGKNPEGPRLE